MRRFFFDKADREGDSIILDEGESRHITRVLRLEPGAEVELLDGEGGLYRACIETVTKRVKVNIVDVLPDDSTDRVPVTVVQGHLKGKKLELVIQKCTELGVSSMDLFWSSRCQGKLDDIRGGKKLERYQRIVESACKQCYRPDLMGLREAVDFYQLLDLYENKPGRLKLLFWEEERTTSLRDISFNEDEVSELMVLLGPEGGLTEQEVQAARDAGWHSVSLGKRILRAETATITAVSIGQYLVGNI